MASRILLDGPLGLGGPWKTVVGYANIRHSVFSDDGGHFYAGGGFKVVIGR